MTKVYGTSILKFPVDVEYSIDGGVSWTILVGGTEREILGEELANDGFIKVRSINVITEIIQSDLHFDQKSFDMVNLKQGKDIVSLSSAFKATNVNNLRIGVMSSCTDFNSICELGTFKNITIETQPNPCTFSKAIYLSSAKSVNFKPQPYATNLDYAFMRSVFKNISNIIAPKATTAYQMCYETKTNTIGRIEIGTGHTVDNNDQRTELGYMFYGLESDSPLSFDANISTSTNTNYVNNGFHMLGRLSKIPYILGAKINVSCSGLAIPPSLSYLFEQSSFMFSDLDITVFHEREYTMNSNYMFSALVNRDKLKSILSRFLIKKARTEAGSVIFSVVVAQDNVDYQFPSISAASRYKLDETLTKGIFDTGIAGFKYAKIVEVNDAVPNIVEITSGIMDMSGYDTFGANNLITEGYKSLNGIYSKFSTEYSEKVSEAVNYMELESETSNDSSVCLFARNGYKTFLVGTELRTYDSVGNLLSTVSGVVDYIGGSLREDGLAIDIVSGGSTNQLGDSTVTNTITSYNTLTGDQIETYDEVNIQNQMVVGCYRSGSESLLNVVKTIFDGLGSSTESKIFQKASYFGSHIDVNGYILGNTCDYVTNSYTEDAEFICYDGARNIYSRVFTR